MQINLSQVPSHHFVFFVEEIYGWLNFTNMIDSKPHSSKSVGDVTNKMDIIRKHVKRASFGESLIAIVFFIEQIQVVKFYPMHNLICFNHS